jgi:hypothetical protein
MMDSNGGGNIFSACKHGIDSSLRSDMLKNNFEIGKFFVDSEKIFEKEFLSFENACIGNFAVEMERKAELLHFLENGIVSFIIFNAVVGTGGDALRIRLDPDDIVLLSGLEVSKRYFGAEIQGHKVFNMGIQGG